MGGGVLRRWILWLLKITKNNVFAYQFVHLVTQQVFHFTQIYTSMFDKQKRPRRMWTCKRGRWASNLHFRDRRTRSSSNHSICPLSGCWRWMLMRISQSHCRRCCHSYRHGETGNPDPYRVGWKCQHWRCCWLKLERLKTYRCQDLRGHLHALPLHCCAVPEETPHPSQAKMTETDAREWAALSGLCDWGWVLRLCCLLYA